MNGVLADFVGRQLTRAAYISLPDTWFGRVDGVHVVDYGAASTDRGCCAIHVKR